MYRILNRVSERPQTDLDKQHMWLVNRHFTGFFFPLFLSQPSAELMVYNGACPRVCGGILVLPQLQNNANLGVYSLIDAYQKLVSLFCILREGTSVFSTFSRVVLRCTSLWVDYRD